MRLYFPKQFSQHLSCDIFYFTVANVMKSQSISTLPCLTKHEHVDEVPRMYSLYNFKVSGF